MKKTYTFLFFLVPLYLFSQDIIINEVILDQNKVIQL